MFKILHENEQVANEAIDARTYTNKFGTKRIRIISDNPDPKEAADETYKTKEVFKKYGAQWDKYDNCWYWNIQLQGDEQKLIQKVEDAVRQANIVLGNKSSERTPITSIEGIQSYDDAAKVKEYLVMIKETLTQVKSVSGKVTFEILDNYINGLADKLEDAKLLEEIAAFTEASRKFTKETGKYAYSPRNDFLIWLQRTPGSTEFGSLPYWEGRGYKPKEDARKIYIISGAGQSLSKTIMMIKSAYPNAEREYMKEIGMAGQVMPKEKQYAFWNWARKNGYNVRTKATFNEVPVYDNLNVEAIAGREQINPPEGLDWYGKDTSEDEKAQVMIEALEEFAKTNHIKAEQSDDLGGAQGSSSYAHIKLLTSDPTVGLLSTFVHEMTHSLIHQPPMKGSEQGKFYDANAHFSRDEKELHADSVAYTVLTSYGFAVQHSVNYLAMWGANKKQLQAYQQLIRNVSMYITKIIEQYAEKKLGTMPDEGEMVSEPEGNEALQESVRRIKSIMNI